MSDPRTCNLALEAADQLYVPTNKSWRLNERMYGGLTGLDKKAMGWPWDGHGMAMGRGTCWVYLVTFG